MSSFLSSIFPSSDQGASLMRGLENTRQKNIKKADQDITAAFAGFDAPFFAKRQKEYMNWALPQLQEQFMDTQKNASFNLANRGIGKGSATTQIGESLGKENEKQREQIVNASLAASNDTKQKVEQQKAGLMGEANQSQDPESVAIGAADIAGSFQAPSLFAPVGQLFGQWANMFLAKQNQAAWAPVTAQANAGFPSAGGTGQGGYGSSFMQPTTTVK